MIVAVVGALGAFGLVGYLAAKTFGLFKAWINRNKNAIPEEEFERLAKAFIDYKKESRRRFRKLEAQIATEDEEDSSSEHTPQSKRIEAPKQSIEIDESETEQKQSGSKDDNNLRNMLRE